MTPQWKAVRHPHVKDGWTVARRGFTEGLFVSKVSAEVAAAARNQNGGTK